MQSRDSIQKYIARSGEKLSRWRTWGQAAESNAAGLLCESCPSGYSNWIAVENDNAIWWIYSDSSDSGIWSSDGLMTTGYKIDYDEVVAQKIYRLVYEAL